MQKLTTVCMLAAALALGACQKAQIAEPLTESTAGNDVDSQMNFWHTLATRSMCSNDEAFHALLLYADGEDPAEDYAGRVAVLKERGWLHEGFDGQANEAVSRGTLAVVLASRLEIDGGVMMRLLGPTPRYATRELSYMGIFPPSSPNQTFSGNEILGIIGRVEDYERVNPAQASAKMLPEALEDVQEQKQRPAEEQAADEAADDADE